MDSPTKKTDLTVIQSPPYPSAGIMILLSKEFKNIQQVLTIPTYQIAKYL